LSSWGAELLAEHNGQKFKFNDLVDVIMGTGHGDVGKNCEPLKARFKGVVDTVRGPDFLCRPVVGSSRGPCPQFPRHSVFKIQAFGACVLGSREPRFFSKLKPVMQERCFPLFIFSSYPLFFTTVIFLSLRFMRRANEETASLIISEAKKRNEARKAEGTIYSFTCFEV
jgi:hypothetical protein